MRLLITIASIVMLHACSSKNEQSDKNSRDNFNNLLTGKVYFYAPELDSTTCKATGACDCCFGNFAFINDSVFISEDVCEDNSGFVKGKYKLGKENLIILTDAISIDEQCNHDADLDTTGTVKNNTYSITIDRIKPSKTKLTRFEFKGKMCFKMGDKETYFVTPDNESKIADYIKSIKERGIWDKLKIN